MTSSGMYLFFRCQLCAYGDRPRCRRICASRRGSLPASRRGRHCRKSARYDECDEFDEARAARGGIAAVDQEFDSRRHACGDMRARQCRDRRAARSRPGSSGCRRNLRQIFAEADANLQFLDLAELALRLHPLGIGGELPQRLDIGRKPGQAVGGALLAIEQPAERVAVDRRRAFAPSTVASASSVSGTPTASWARGIRSGPSDRGGAADSRTCKLLSDGGFGAARCSAQKQQA